MSKVIFIPPSWESARYREHYAAEAEARGVKVIFVGSPLSPSDVVDPDQMVIAQSVSPDIAHLVNESWVVVHIEAQGVVDVFHAMHPDEGVGWAATHGSAGLAMAAWLLELGARRQQVENSLSWPDLVLPGIDQAGAPARQRPSPANPLAIYDEGSIPQGKSWAWAPSMLGGADPVALAAGTWMDITGHARHIVNGPYIFLPPGHWKATLALSIDTESSNPIFVCQWGGAAHETPVSEVRISHSGHYEITLDTQLKQPDAVRFLFASKTALFSGRVRIGDLKVHREMGPAADHSEEKSTVSCLTTQA